MMIAVIRQLRYHSSHFVICYFELFLLLKPWPFQNITIFVSRFIGKLKVISLFFRTYKLELSHRLKPFLDKEKCVKTSFTTPVFYGVICPFYHITWPGALIPKNSPFLNMNSTGRNLYMPEVYDQKRYVLWFYIIAGLMKQMHAETNNIFSHYWFFNFLQDSDISWTELK